MNTKLTLKIDESVISQAKTYAKAKNTSLSKMVENYLQTVTSKTDDVTEAEVSPLVKSLIGVISDPRDDHKKDYSEYLGDKYQ